MEQQTQPQPQPDPTNPGRLYRADPTEYPRGIKADLDDGRCVHIGPEWRGIPRDFHLKAVRAGADFRSLAEGESFPSQEKVTQQDAAPPRVGTDEAVREGLIRAIDAETPDLFNATTGLPDAGILTKACGFRVEHDQAVRVYRQLRKEIDEANAEADAAEEKRVRAETERLAQEAAAERQAAADKAAREAEREKTAGDAADADGKGDANEQDKKRKERKKEIAKKVKEVAPRKARQTAATR